MAITKFVPELWTAAVQAPFQGALVYGQAGVSNRDYEGEIRQQGDTVNVTTINDPTIRTYDKTTNLTTEDVTDAEVQMSIDQGAYFSFRVNDVDRVQAAGNFQTPALQQAGYKLAKDQDSYVAGVMADGVAAGNALGGVDIDTASDAYDLLVDLAVLLDESDAPDVGRWVVVTAGFHGVLLKDSRFVASGDGTAAATRLNGQVGEAAGFRVLKSNNAPEIESGATEGNRTIIAGVSIATSVADQILETEALRSEARFADVVRGLNVYGSQVFYDDGLATADVDIDPGS